MKKILIGILRKFKYVKELLSCLNDTSRKLNAMQAERTERRYELYYSCDSVTIDMYVFYKDENNLETSTYCTIKVFPYGDDPEYAKLCAEELLNALNSTN